jgi:hypothetical protein
MIFIPRLAEGREKISPCFRQRQKDGENCLKE